MRASHRKLIVFTALGVVAALAALGPERIKSFGSSTPAPASHSPSEASPAPSTGAHARIPVALPERPTLQQPAGALFGPYPSPTPAPKTKLEPVAPAPPPMPYRFAGKVVHGGKLQVFLSKNDVAIPITEGKTLEDGYRVEAIEPHRATLVYLPLNHKESIPFTASPQPSPTVPSSPPLPPTRAASASAPGGSNKKTIGTIPTASVIAVPPVSASQDKRATSAKETTQKIDATRTRLLWEGPTQV
jgi:hypothetical protein